MFHMNSFIRLSAITILAALALVGCNQSSSTETPSSNSKMNDANGMMSGSTNMTATNSMPNMNMPANTNATGAANDATR
jgi:ABC-type oligopeptide transport system substrate-binding subunit